MAYLEGMSNAMLLQETQVAFDGGCTSIYVMHGDETGYTVHQIDRWNSGSFYNTGFKAPFGELDRALAHARYVAETVASVDGSKAPKVVYGIPG